MRDYPKILREKSEMVNLIIQLPDIVKILYKRMLLFYPKNMHLTFSICLSESKIMPDHRRVGTR